MELYFRRSAWQLFCKKKKKNYFLIIYFLAAWVLVAAHRIYSCGIGVLRCSMCDLAPDRELNLSPLHWKPGGLATEPPGKSLAALVKAGFEAESLEGLAAPVREGKEGNTREHGSAPPLSLLSPPCLRASVSSGSPLPPEAHPPRVSDL